MARLTRESVGARFAYRLGERTGEGRENQPTIPGILYVRLDLRRAHDINSLFEAGIGASIASLPLASRLALCVLARYPPPVRLFPASHSLCVILYLFTSPFSAFTSHADRHPFIVFTLLTSLIIGGLTCGLNSCRNTCRVIVSLPSTPFKQISPLTRHPRADCVSKRVTWTDR